MHVHRFAIAIGLCAGIAVLAGRAQGATTDLIDGSFNIVSSQEPNTQTLCVVSAEGDTFEVSGTAAGNDGMQAVVVSYDTPQPTSVSRKNQTASIKQSSFSFLSFKFGAAAAITGIAQKCSVTGSVNTKKANGSITVSCKTDNLFGLLTANEATSLQTAFANSTTVKVKLNSKGAGSLTIKCKGPFGPF
jgi:hypothetical protein